MERMEATMEVIQNQKMDEERALYAVLLAGAGVF